MSAYTDYRKSQMGTGPAVPTVSPPAQFLRAWAGKEAITRADVEHIPGAAHWLRELYDAGFVFYLRDERMGKVSHTTLRYYQLKARGLEKEIRTRDKLAADGIGSTSLILKHDMDQAFSILNKVPGNPGHRPLREQVERLYQMYVDAAKHAQTLQQEPVSDPAALLAASAEG